MSRSEARPSRSPRCHRRPARRSLEEARSLAARFGWNHELVATMRGAWCAERPAALLSCKIELFEVLEPKARSLGAPIVGAQHRRPLDHRPRTAYSSAVFSVRAPLSRRVWPSPTYVLSLPNLGLPTATNLRRRALFSFRLRIRVTPAGLRRIERAEDFARSLGFHVLRAPRRCPACRGSSGGHYAHKRRNSWPMLEEPRFHPRDARSCRVPAGLS